MDQHSSDSPSAQAHLALDVWIQVLALASSPDVVEAKHAFMRDVGLTAGPVRALQGLLDGGPQSMRSLAARLGCDKSYVTSLIRPLVANHLVTLEPDDSDGRVKVVTLSEQGLATARRARDVSRTPPRTIQHLDDGTLAQIRGLLPTATPSETSVI